MKASINTSPLAASWAMAGTRPPILAKLGISVLFIFDEINLFALNLQGLDDNFSNSRL